MYLVASASTKNEDLIQIVKAYRSLSVTSLIVSKLDESQTYGNVFNLLMRSKLPVSYFTSGQAIPHSLEKATLEKVVELILNPDRESKPWHVPPGKTAEIIPYIKSNSSRFRDPLCGQSQLHSFPSSRMRLGQTHQTGKPYRI